MKGESSHLSIHDNDNLNTGAIREEGLKWLSIIPIKYEKDIIGCMNISSHKPEKIKALVIDALEAIGSQIGGVITKLKIIEALIDSEEKYRILVENIQDGVFIIQNGKIRFLNESFARTVGYQVEEILNQPFRTFIAPEDVNFVSERYRKRQLGEEVPGEYEFCMLHKDGETRIVVNMNVGLVNYRDEIASMGTIRDITERKMVETALTKSREMYRTLVDNAFDAIYLLKGKRYEYVNPRFCEITGYTYDQITSANFDYEVMLPERTKEFMQERYESRVKGEEISNQYSTQVLNKSGRLIDIEVSTTSIGTTGDVAILGIMRDVTERKLAEEELRLSEEQYRQLFQDDLTGNYICTPNGKILDCNLAYTKIFGYESVEKAKQSSAQELYFNPEER